jgi:hypothetical protein
MAFGVIGQAYQVSETTSDVFFYGLFMDEDILRNKGVHPRVPRKATVPGYRLRIGQRAMLVPQADAQTFGMVFALTEREIASLYAEPGLEMYRPESVIATFEDGMSAAVTTFNLREASAAEGANAEYAAKLGAVLQRLGFPSEYVRSVADLKRYAS